MGSPSLTVTSPALGSACTSPPPCSTTHAFLTHRRYSQGPLLPYEQFRISKITHSIRWERSKPTLFCIETLCEVKMFHVSKCSQSVWYSRTETFIFWHETSKYIAVEIHIIRSSFFLVEVHINYCDVLDCRSDRRQLLHRQYLFWCTCSRCTARTHHEEDIIKCGQCHNK